MEYKYMTRGTCSRQIDYEIDEQGLVRNVRFTGGCNGNLKGIGRLIDGLTPAQVVERLAGIRCGVKETSCPDQLACALQRHINQ